MTNNLYRFAVFVTLLLTGVPLVAQQVYKHVDDSGRVYYSDQPLGKPLGVTKNTTKSTKPGTNRQGAATAVGEPQGATSSTDAGQRDDRSRPLSSGATSSSGGGTGGAGGGGGGGGASMGGASNAGSAPGAPATAGATSSPAPSTAQPPASAPAATANAGANTGAGPSSAAPATMPAANAPSTPPASKPAGTPPSASAAAIPGPAQPTPVFTKPTDFGSGKLRGFVIGHTGNRPSDAYFRDMAATGANLGRLFVRVTRCKDCIEYSVSDADLAQADFVLGKARDLGFKVVLAVQLGDERENGALWGRADLQAAAAALWRRLAQKYKDNAYVAGYDLLNEPIVTIENTHPSQALFNSVIAPIIRAIRSVDRNHVVIVQPSPGGENYAFAELKPVSDEKLVYSLHFYKPHNVTHQGVSASWPMGRTYPSDKVDVNTLDEYLEPVRTFSKKHNIPIYVGEFSCVRWAPDGSRIKYIEDSLRLFETEKWAWTFHEWRGWPGWDPENESTSTELQAGTRSTNSAPMRLLRSALSLNNK